MKTALYFTAEKDGRVRCGLCRHGCVIPEGKTGLCRLRRNVNGALETMSYGMASSIWTDPIEKKPLFHFMPGTHALSFGSVGCNFRCIFCQNYDISQEWSLRLARQIAPEEVVALAQREGCESVSWTYNEPTIWYEFTLDASKLLHRAGIPTNYVTNGYIAEAPLREIAPYLDAMNIDVKAFTEDFYRKLVGATLSGVMETCSLAMELGIFIELTYLIIPTKNDDPSEIRRFARWVAESLSPEIPVHFSRFHPDYKLRDLPPTPMDTLLQAKSIARSEGLRYVYLGNIHHTDDENTRCPVCGALLIERWGFSVRQHRLKDRRCPECAAEINIVAKPRWLD
ncbi:MAG: AmmeMemoRadiSam system radical SAM enzyme [Candidatus Thermoplasmatota archaeon]